MTTHMFSGFATSSEKIFSEIFENPVRIRPLVALFIVRGDFRASVRCEPVRRRAGKKACGQLSEYKRGKSCHDRTGVKSTDPAAREVFLDWVREFRTPAEDSPYTLYTYSGKEEGGNLFFVSIEGPTTGGLHLTMNEGDTMGKAEVHGRPTGPPGTRRSFI